MMRIWLIAGLAAILGVCAGEGARPRPRKPVAVPPGIVEPEWLEKRKQEQLETRSRFEVYLYLFPSAVLLQPVG